MKRESPGLAPCVSHLADRRKRQKQEARAIPTINSKHRNTQNKGKILQEYTFYKNFCLEVT